MKRFFSALLKYDKLVGDDPCKCWRRMRFLDIQRGGSSQKDVLVEFDNLLQDYCSFDISTCGDDSNTFVYLDDVSFTGNRIRQDIEHWIDDECYAEAGGQDHATVHIVTMAMHRGGRRYAYHKIRNHADDRINFEWRTGMRYQDVHYDFEESYKYSDVLHPVGIPHDSYVQAYVDSMNRPPRLRTAGSIGPQKIFSSDASRQLLEEEFLKADVRIREMCPFLGRTQRPLGHITLETLGFGSLVVTFRNCPNNAPLALWADNPWYPLFRRRTNTDTERQLNTRDVPDDDEYFDVDIPF